MADETQDSQHESPTLPNEGGTETGGTVSDTGSATTSPDNETQLKLQSLEQKLQEAEKRIAGQTRSWQEERAAREKAEQELQKFSKYKDVIDFSELDEIVGTDEKPKGQSSPPAFDPLVNRLSNLEIQVLESNFALQNADKAFVFKDPDLKEKTEVESMKIIQKENAEYGRIISKPDEIISKATEHTIAFINKMKEEGAKSAMEERKKLDDTKSDLNGSQAKQAPAKSEEEEQKDLSTDEFVNLYTSEQSKAKKLA